MKHILFLSFVALLIASCSGKKANIAKGEDETAALYSWRFDDAAMQKAVTQANGTLDSFTNALAAKAAATANFALKIRFPGIGGAEDVWVTDVKTTPAGFWGVVNNYPALTMKVKKGNPVKFTKQNISDGMYTDNGKLCGGYTIKLLYSRMTFKEKTKFDTAFVLKTDKQKLVVN